MKTVFSLLIDSSDAYIDFENLGRLLERMADQEIERPRKNSTASTNAEFIAALGYDSWRMINMYKLAAQNWLRSAEMAKADIEAGRSEHPDVDKMFHENNYASYLGCLEKIAAIEAADAAAEARR